MNTDADDLLPACLQLRDICVKNAGDLFLVEIASREFMDNLVSILRVPALNQDVKNMIFRIIQNSCVRGEAESELCGSGS